VTQTPAPAPPAKARGTDVCGKAADALPSERFVLKFQHARTYLGSVAIEFIIKGEGIVATFPERTLARNIKVKRDK
jgi:hypothetical protein